MPVSRTADTQPVCVIGAGIAGLTAALCLAERGFSVVVLERAGVLSEAGAGIQLSPNATRILTRLGLDGDLSAHWHEPSEIRLVSGPTLRRLAHVPLGAQARQRWGSPYAVLRRAELQQVLAAAVMRHPRCVLHLGVSLDTAEPHILAQRLGDLCGVPPRLVVGADGVWSAMRGLVPGAAEARYTGRDAWRATIASDAVRAVIDPSIVTAFLGPSTHLVAYPQVTAGMINLVAVGDGAPGAEDRRAWSDMGGDVARLHRQFGGFDRRLSLLFGPQARWSRWPVFEVGDGLWHAASRDGLAPIVLIGDAAHAMSPYAAQGAAMAIEDAWHLAASCATWPDEPERATRDFAGRRKPRIGKVAARAAFNRFAYHARGPIRLGRDLVLSLRSADSLAADFDWLYGA